VEVQAVPILPVPLLRHYRLRVCAFTTGIL
jgi:hypothetical protein